MAKESCRKAFFSALRQCMQKDPSIYVTVTDSRQSAACAEIFRELPHQCAELGIAEQNAVAFAAGISMMGKNVFAAGPACFLSARAYEQIKVDVAYNRANVKIIGVSAGVSYGPLGQTHTSLHDLAEMRCLPNLEIFAPSDAVQAAFMARYLAGHYGPAYVRMGRGEVETLYSEQDSFEAGKAKLVCGGDDIALIACGEMVWTACEAAGILAKQGIGARVLDMFTVKPFDEQAVRRAARETRAILTVEEHSIHGGLGELTARIACEDSPVKVKVLGFPDEECCVGASAELKQLYGLTPEQIAQQAVRLLGE